jgi:putative inorganic carbon (HCO3(-)) transporter
MRSTFLAAILAYVLFVGFSYPFAAVLGYVWVDIVKPQGLAYSLIRELPVALIAAVIALASFVMDAKKKKVPRLATVLLLAFFATWITFTAMIADQGIQPWIKWDWAFKVVIFSIFIPFVIRTRVHIEAFLLTMMFSVSTIAFSGGVKAAMGSGGYGVLALMGSTNTGLAESSTLAAVCVMQLPIMHYMYNHSIIFPSSRLFKLLIIITAVVNLFAVVGTGARTGLVAAACLAGLYALRSRHKIAVGVVFLLAMAIVPRLDLGDTAWGSRMSSIGTYQQDSSALGRIAVWKWTMDFALANPLGGGFDAFKLNRIALANDEGIQYYDAREYRGKAFHNIFFEVMGEQGLVGFVVYLSIIGATFWTLFKVRQLNKNNPEQSWLVDISTKLSDALMVLLVGGMFVGIAYQCYIFYLVALSISLGELGRQLAVKTSAVGNAEQH